MSRVVSKVVIGGSWAGPLWDVGIVRGTPGNENAQLCRSSIKMLPFRQPGLAVCAMDSLDQQLIAQLRTDARASVAALAHKLGVSRGTVTNRIAKLEEAGVIVGYTVKLRPDATPNQITAWTSIAVEGNQTRKVIATLLGEPGIAAIHDTNGRWDLLAELRSSSLQELANVLERLRLIKGIGATETSIHLQTYKLS
jgi:DNA-binding Lrp family transcriptional regulator